MNGETGKYEAALHSALRRAQEVLPPPLDEDTLERSCEALVQAGAPRRRQLVASWEPAACVQLVSRLVETSWSQRHEAPRRCLKWAEAAVEVAERLGFPPGLAQLLADVKAESWAALGNAYRLEESYLSAEEALAKAERYRRRGTGNPLLAARVLSLRSSLQSDRRCLLEATELSSKAVKLYREAGEPSLEGRELLKLARAHANRGEAFPALLYTLEAAPRLEFRGSPDRALDLVHNSLFYFFELGQPAVALALLAKAESLYQLLGEEPFLVRARWLRGKLHAALEQWQVAEGFLEHVRQEFLARSLPYDASLAGLDLALVYARQGKHYRVQLLAAQMYEVFLAKGIPREASAALLVFHDAAERNRADAAAIAGVVSRLRELERTGG